jgi:hypothetical protein
LSNICQVKDLGNPKSKKTKETPSHYEVCEPCKQHLDAGEDIPMPLLAKLVKFKLLACKENDKRRRDAEKRVTNAVTFLRSFWWFIFVSH